MGRDLPDQRQIDVVGAAIVDQTERRTRCGGSPLSGSASLVARNGRI
jgi:hypothetical protein